MLFIATFPERFTDTLFADMRGYISPEGISPFWSAIGERLWKCSYQEILQKLDREEISLCKLIPNYPIHWNLLPIEAQQYAGKIHPNTQAAYHLLTKEGLSYQGEISILDGGPIITANTKAIRTIAHSIKGFVDTIVDELEETGIDILLSNERDIDFRCCHTRLEKAGDQGIIIDQATAKALHITPEDPIRYIKL